MSVAERKLSVVCDGLRLNAGAFVPDEPVAAVVLLHGIPSVAPSDPADLGYPGLARRFAGECFVAAWADMRAVRGSQGYFSIEGWVRDARAVVDATRALDSVAGLRLALVGSSAGGAASAEAVRRGAPVDALVLLAAPAQWVTFATHPEHAVRLITDDAGMALSPETLADPAAWAAEFDRVSTEESIVGVSVPTLIVHGTADDVVPVDHAYRIAERAHNADLKIIEGAVHQLRRDDRVIAEVVEWLKKRLA